MSGRAQCGTHLEFGIYQRRKAQGFSKKFTLPETKPASLSLKIGRIPKGKDRLPTIDFQGRTVSCAECRVRGLVFSDG